MEDRRTAAEKTQLHIFTTWAHRGKIQLLIMIRKKNKKNKKLTAEQCDKITKLRPWIHLKGQTELGSPTAAACAVFPCVLVSSGHISLLLVIAAC